MLNTAHDPEGSQAFDPVQAAHDLAAETGGTVHDLRHHLPTADADYGPGEPLPAVIRGDRAALWVPSLGRFAVHDYTRECAGYAEDLAAAARFLLTGEMPTGARNR